MTTQKCDHCTNPPRHTVRSKNGPGQWQLLGKCCDLCLGTAVSQAREAIEAKDTVQCIPYVVRDWPQPTE